MLQTDPSRLFSEIDNFGKDEDEDELDDFLRTPTIAGPASNDPIQWWYRLGDTPLENMALDFLSAPGVLYLSSLGLES